MVHACPQKITPKMMRLNAEINLAGGERLFLFQVWMCCSALLVISQKLCLISPSFRCGRRQLTFLFPVPYVVGLNEAASIKASGPDKLESDKGGLWYLANDRDKDNLVLVDS